MMPIQRLGARPCPGSTAAVVALAGMAVVLSLLAGARPAVASTAHPSLLPASEQGPAYVSFTDIGAGLPGAGGIFPNEKNAYTAAWGDYDNDGDLDILLMGAQWTGTQWVRTSRVYRNDGGSFRDIVAGLPGMIGAGAWGDYDNDGDLDIAMSGHVDASTGISRVYRNDGGHFVDIEAGLPSLYQTSVAWGDYDNDGDLDLLLTGATAPVYSAPVTGIYRNDGGGHFTDVAAGLPGVCAGEAVWGDYDNDGDLDILLTGLTSDYEDSGISRLYRNDLAGGFVEVSIGLTRLAFSRVAWGDYDSDGDLDILLTGASYTATSLTYVYRNEGGGTFTNVNVGLPSGWSGGVAWGDYDNDGDLDFVLTGYTDAMSRITRVYRKDTSAFVDISAGLTDLALGTAVWGDYDSDGDLDVLVTGSGATQYVSRIYRSIGAPTNAAPTTPTGLAAQVVGNQVTLSWNPSTDAQTPGAGLSYNLRVGTTPGGSEIVSAMADAATGKRCVVQLGNAQKRTSWTLQLPGGQYYWSVQAVDGAFAGSVFAPEQSFGVITFARGSAVLPGAKYSCVAWADYDGDADLDLLIAGTPDNGVTGLTRLYRNDGSGAFAEVATGLPGVYKGSVAWGDCDGDGDLDLALAGYGSDGPLSRLYRNAGGGSFVDVGAGLPGVYESSVAWGDYDNDGDLDVLLAGRTNAGTCLSRLYRNDGAGLFADAGAGLPGVHIGGVAWGDYDGDGDLDLLLTGDTGSGYVSRLYRNEAGGSFVDAGAGLVGVEYGAVAWGDYDSDGDLDILLTGYASAAPWYTSRVYRNDGAGTFTDIGASLPGVDGGTAAWADFDNDGDLDVLLTGYTGFERLSRIYRNVGGGIFVSSGDVGDPAWGTAAWGDYDNDGDLDVALAGETASGYTTAVYRSEGAPTNGSPSPPDHLVAERVGGRVILSWSPAVDDHTPTTGLTYNLRVGTTPGGGELVPGMAIPSSGYRQVVQLGNAQQRTSWAGSLPPGPCYWSVQAVDGAYAGSVFATEVVPVEASPLRTSLALSAVRPNPSRTGLFTVEFTLPTAAPARLQILDIRGRRVTERTIIGLGRHSVLLGEDLSPGLYVVRLSQGDDVATTRAAVLR